MPRLPHGSVPTVNQMNGGHADLVKAATAAPLAFAAARLPQPNRFDYLFLSLQDDPDNLLPESADTNAHLKALGAAMEDAVNASGAAPNPPGDSNVPALYTYFGQFIDHDVTLEVQPADLPTTVSGTMPELLAPNMAPLPLNSVRNALRNFRSPTLDLDSLYGPPAPFDFANGAKLKVGHATAFNPPQAAPLARPAGKALEGNDLPREGAGADVLHDRAALIGDPRNDENLIVSQLHLAFIRAHNALVDQGHGFEEAQRILTHHYQFLALHDFLPRIADPQIVDDIIRHGNKVFDPHAEPPVTPLEFSVACYRFGHTMARDDYNFNTNFGHGQAGGPATLSLLFTFTALSGQLGFGQGTETLPENWIIQWENFVDTGDGRTINMARRLDTKLAGKLIGGPNQDPHGGLFQLNNLQGVPEQPDDAGRLSVRNLLRGYRLRLPTGQAVATALGVTVLSPDDILDEASTQDQKNALQNGGFHLRTPLWYYVLAEADVLGQGNRLGPVGSTVVAEVLVGMVRRTPGSILRRPGWQPSLPSATPGKFELGDLLRFAGVLAGGQTAHTIVVQPGDTLSGIARAQLGHANRWPEIFLLNRSIISNPDRIFPGQVLTLPSGPAPQPAPRVYVVKPGDTLSGIAASQLHDQTRWPEIVALNREIITNPDVIVPNQVLILPA